MDLSQYAELFLAESREHLSACNQLLLDWERSPANLAPVGGLFRAVHTVKGMAATMGYARATDLAHRAENLLDLVRRGGRPATDDLLQLLFRARAGPRPGGGWGAEECAGRFGSGRGGGGGAAERGGGVGAGGEGGHVRGGGEGGRPPPGAAAPPAAPETKSRHIRVDLGRLDGLMDLIGELVTVRGRLNELAANARDPAIDDVAIQVSRLSRELQAEIIQARMTPVWQVFDRFPRLDRKSTRLNSSHSQISYAVFCLKKKKNRYARVRAYDNNNQARRRPRA